MPPPGASADIVLDAVPDALVAVDREGVVTLANAAALRLLPASGRGLVGSHLAELSMLDADGRPATPASHPLWAALRGGRHRSPVVVGLGTQERRRWYHVGAVALRDEGSAEVWGAVVTYADVTSSRLARERLERQALTDPLTGLANRTLLYDRLRQAMARVRRRGGGSALLLVDVDHFKDVNDRHGHQAGDAVLAELGARLGRFARDEDTPARLGGEEFAVLLEQVSGVEEAASVARRLRVELARPYDLPHDGRVVAMTVSVGIAVTDLPDTDPDQLYRDADLALYRAKEGGRDRVVVFDDRLRAWQSERSTRRRQVEEAFRGGHLVLWTRPVHELRGRRRCGARVVAALPEGIENGIGELPPTLVADSPLGPQVDAWMVATALAQDPSGPLHVRLSARTLLLRDHADLAARLVAEAGRRPDELLLEVHERDLQEHSGAVLAAAAGLHERGMLVGLVELRGDRVPVRRLAAFAADRVTLSPALLRDAAEDDVSRIAARALTRLHTELGAAVCAEQLHDEAAIETALAVGCSLGSGRAVG